MSSKNQFTEPSWREVEDLANEIRTTLARETCTSKHKHVQLRYLLGSDGWYDWLQFCKEQPTHPLVKKFLE